MTDSLPVVWTIVVAAGSGTRFGADKLNIVVERQTTVLDRSLAVAASVGDGVVLVVREDDPALCRDNPPSLRCVAGGASRSESVRNGLAAVPVDAHIVLIHDAARPLATPELYSRVIGAVSGGAVAVVPVVPVVDTVRSVDGTPVDRDNLRAVQTPQGFRADILRAAHDQGGQATDDATLVECLGHSVVLVAGDVRNLKITGPADIHVARALLDNKQEEG